MREKLDNTREIKEKIVSKQFSAEKINQSDAEGDIICGNSAMGDSFTLLYSKKKAQLFGFGKNSKG